MDTILQDIRFAFRSLRRSPGLVLVATLSLALGIAVNVTIYAAVDILLLRPHAVRGTPPAGSALVHQPVAGVGGNQHLTGRFPGLAGAEPDHFPGRIPRSQFQPVRRRGIARSG